MPYSELIDWQNAAEFVANFVDYELLDEPTELVSAAAEPTIPVYLPIMYNCLVADTDREDEVNALCIPYRRLAERGCIALPPNHRSCLGPH